MLRPESTPVACNLAVLGEAERLERAALASALGAAVREVSELPCGYALRLDGRSVVGRRIERFMALERACCPFLTFTTHSGSAGDDDLVLEITGGEGVKEFLAAQFGGGTGSGAVPGP